MVFMGEMTPKSRILSAIFGGRVDRTPVGCITSVATHEQMDKTGVSFPEAHTEPEAMAALAAASYEILGWDTIKVPFGVWNLAAALGAPMDWGDRNRWPDGKHPIYSEPREVKVPADLLEKPSTSAVIEAIKILRKKYPHVAIVGSVMGPVTQSFHLIGVENVMRMIAADPTKILEFFEIFKEPVIEYAQAQVAAGADLLDYADHATGGLVSANTYKTMVMPIHKKIVSQIMCPLVLHICGDTLDRLEHINEAGFPCFNIDSLVDPYEAKMVVKDNLSLWGGVSNIKAILQGTPSEVREEAFKAMEAGYEILGNECTVPLQSKDENLIAMVDAAREYPAESSAEDKIKSFGKGLARSFLKEDKDLLLPFMIDMADYCREKVKK